MNGVRKYPGVVYPKFRIITNGRMVRFETNSETAGISLVVEYDGRSRALIRISSQYQNGMEGLCGNFDGDPTNDMRLKNGTDVRSHSKKYSLIGNSWKVYDAEDSR